MEEQNMIHNGSCRTDHNIIIADQMHRRHPVQVPTDHPLGLAKEDLRHLQ